MKTDYELLRKMNSDLAINAPFVKGQTIKITKCWHFCTEGDKLEVMFYDVADFKAGMNRIFKLARKFKIIIIAFVLMDTHVHFILYGDYDECNRFMHEYVRLTSHFISVRHGDKGRLRDVPINYQVIDNDLYLKTCISYVLRNPVAAGLNYTYYDYPWSSGSLYFRCGRLWTSPEWYEAASTDIGAMSQEVYRGLFNTHDAVPDWQLKIIDGVVFPGEYVAYDVVERIFKSVKSFSFFMGQNKDAEIEAKGGAISNLSIPIAEMRQNRDDVCMELFGHSNLRKLNTQQRTKLAKALKFRYNCSSKQVLRISGLSAADAVVLI